MIIRWGRKGLLAGAIVATFVTPVTVTTSYINEVQQRPSFKLEIKHVTPSATAPVSYINRAHVRPGRQFEFKHMTPVEAPDAGEAGGFTGYGRRHETDGVIAIIMALYESGEV